MAKPQAERRLSRRKLPLVQEIVDRTLSIEEHQKIAEANYRLSSKSPERRISRPKSPFQRHLQSPPQSPEREEERLIFTLSESDKITAKEVAKSVVMRKKVANNKARAQLELLEFQKLIREKEKGLFKGLRSRDLSTAIKSSRLFRRQLQQEIRENNNTIGVLRNLPHQFFTEKRDNNSPLSAPGAHRRAKRKYRKKLEEAKMAAKKNKNSNAPISNNVQAQNQNSEASQLEKSEIDPKVMTQLLQQASVVKTKPKFAERKAHWQSLRQQAHNVLPLDPSARIALLEAAVRSNMFSPKMRTKKGFQLPSEDQNMSQKSRKKRADREYATKAKKSKQNAKAREKAEKKANKK